MLIFIAILCKTWCFQHGMLDYSWVICIFQRMDFGSHRMGIVTGLYGTLGLENDVAIVEEFVDIMYGDAAFGIATTDHVLVYAVAIHSLAAMKWDEGRMDVHDRTRIGIDKILGNEHQVTGEHDEVDMIFAEQSHHSFLVGHLLPGDQFRGYAQPAGTLKYVGISLVAHYQGDLCHLAPFEVIGDILGV